MRRRVPQTFDVCHLRTHLRSFAFFFHLLGGEINHEEHEGHGEFRIAVSLGGTLALWGARAASRPFSAACRKQFSPAGCRRMQASCLRSPETEMNAATRSSVFSRSRCVLLLMMRLLWT